jgi:hypothetical protein
LGALTAPVGTFSAASHRRSTLRSPAFASSMIVLAIISSVRSPGRLTAARAVSKATPMRRVASGSKVWPLKKSLMGTSLVTSRRAKPIPLASFTLKRCETKKPIKSALPGNGVDVLVFRKERGARGDALSMPEARMPKKRHDKQQNQEEPRVSLGRHMPPPAPGEDEAFARRAGKIIGDSNTSLHKTRDAGGNKRLRRSG